MVKGLTELQNELKAPKSKYNDYGKFNYRSCEDILEAVKPLLLKYNLTQIITDRVEVIGDRYYFVSTVRLSDGENFMTVEGWAREPENKKGMDESQISGTASSYARKYALNGMYAIDDTKDADTNEYHDIQDKSEKKYATVDEKKTFQTICELNNVNAMQVLKKIGWEEGEKLTKEQLGKANKALKGMLENDI